MSTSANSVYYRVYRKGIFIEEHRQNRLCKSTIKQELAQYQPPEDYSIILRCPDEDEKDYFSQEMLLKDYLNGVKVPWKGKTSETKIRNTMNAKKQITFNVTIGSNNDEVTEKMLIQAAFDTELTFNNLKPEMRMHIGEVTHV
ncbi:MAG: hypothetical protein ABFD15_06645 [Methanofastidiosum sp.]